MRGSGGRSRRRRAWPEALSEQQWPRRVRADRREERAADAASASAKATLAIAEPWPYAWAVASALPAGGRRARTTCVEVRGRSDVARAAVQGGQGDARGPPRPRRTAHAPRLGDHHRRCPAGARLRAVGCGQRPPTSGAVAAAAADAGRQAGRAVPRSPGRRPAALRPRPLQLPAGAGGFACAGAAAGGEARQHAFDEILQPEPFADVFPAPAGFLSGSACTGKFGIRT